MRPDDDEIESALTEVWDRVAALCRDLDDTDLARPTRLGDWTVHDLLAHLAPRGYTRLLGAAGPGEPDVANAADVLRVWNEEAGLARRLAPEIAAAAHAEAARTSLPELVDRFERSRETLSAAMAHPDDVVDYFGAGLLPVREVVRLGVLESTVHLLDLLHALQRPREIPSSAARITKQVLAEIAPDVAFVEAATGRRPDAPFPVMQ